MGKTLWYVNYVSIKLFLKKRHKIKLSLLCVPVFLLPRHILRFSVASLVSYANTHIYTYYDLSFIFLKDTAIWKLCSCKEILSKLLKSQADRQKKQLLGLWFPGKAGHVETHMGFLFSTKQIKKGG